MQRLRARHARWISRPLMALLPVALVVAAGCGGPSSASASLQAPPTVYGLTVSPKHGRPASVLRFGFRSARTTSGTHDARVYSYVLTITGPSRRSCSSVHETAVAVHKPQAPQSVEIKPPQGGWCAGSYTAAVEELARPACGAGQACPMFIAVVGRLGTTHFTIY